MLKKKIALLFHATLAETKLFGTGRNSHKIINKTFGNMGHPNPTIAYTTKFDYVRPRMLQPRTPIALKSRQRSPLVICGFPFILTNDSECVPPLGHYRTLSRTRTHIQISIPLEFTKSRVLII